MKIRLFEIRALIREQLVTEQIRGYVRMILEGFMKDKEFLVSNNPDLASELETLDPKAVSWLTPRFGESPKIKEDEPLKKSVSTLKTYIGKSAAINQQYKTSDTFKKLVDENFPVDLRSWKTPAEFSSMTVKDMDQILFLSARRKATVDVGSSMKDYRVPEEDRIGKIGPWNMWMPTNEANSCMIAGYNPETLDPKTTWCTARTKGSNLFYNYSSQGIILYYVIKDNPSEDNDWVSIGFMNGKPMLNGESGEEGGSTVNRANKGLNTRDLKKIFGGHFSSIIDALKRKNEVSSKNHPAIKKVSEAAENLELLQQMLKGKSVDEKANLIESIIGMPNVHDDVIRFAASFPKDSVRRSVATKDNIPEDVIIELSKDKELRVRWGIALRKKLPESVIRELSNDEELAPIIAANSKLPDDLLKQFSSSSSSRIRSMLAMNKFLPKIYFAAMAADESHEVRSAITSRKDFNDEKLFITLSGDKAEEVRKSVAQSENCPPAVLDNMSEDDSEEVRVAVSLNKNTSISTLAKMQKSDPSESVRGLAEYSLSKKKK